MKKNIMANLVTVLIRFFMGFPLFVGADLFLEETGPSVTPTTRGSSLVPCGRTGIGQKPCTFDDFIKLAKNIMDFLLIKVAIPLATLGIAYAGLKYVMVGANPNGIKEAETIFKDTLWGLAIAFSSWLIVKFFLSLGDTSLFSMYFQF